MRTLNLYLENERPFKELHHELFRRLQKREGQVLIAQQTGYPSRKRFGISSGVTLWRKKN